MQIKVNHGEARINSVRSLKSTDDIIILFVDFDLKEMSFESYGSSDEENSNSCIFYFEPWNGVGDLPSNVEVTLDKSWVHTKYGISMGHYSATILLAKILVTDMKELYPPPLKRVRYNART